MSWKLLTTKLSPFTADNDFSLTQVVPAETASRSRYVGGGPITSVNFLVLFYAAGEVIVADKGSLTLDVLDVSYTATPLARVISRAQLFTSATGDIQYSVDANKLQGEMCVSIRDVVAATGATSMSVYYREGQ